MTLLEFLIDTVREWIVENALPMGPDRHDTRHALLLQLGTVFLVVADDQLLAGPTNLPDREKRTITRNSLPIAF